MPRSASSRESMAAPYEQLRRLKNTIMGAGHRLSIVARSGEVSAEDARVLAQTAAELATAAQRLERLLATWRSRG